MSTTGLSPAPVPTAGPVIDTVPVVSRKVPIIFGVLTLCMALILLFAPQDGETPGFDQADHLSALLEHAPALQVHTVLADVRSVPDRAVLDDVVEAAGARLVVADIAADDGSARHDPAKLAAAYDALIEAGDSPRG